MGKSKRKIPTWLIIVLAIVAVILVLVLAYFLIRDAGAKDQRDVDKNLGDATPMPTATIDPDIEYKANLSDSSSYRTLTANSDVWTESGKKGVYFISRENVQYSIYNVKADNLFGGGESIANYEYMWLNSEADGFYVLVNVAGKDVNLSDFYILTRDDTNHYASRALINCYEAETVNLSGAILNATILAPKATVNVSNAFIYGDVRAKTTTGSAKAWKTINFTGRDKLMTMSQDVNLSSEAVRYAAISNLRWGEYASRYSEYTENSPLARGDIEYVTSLTFDGWTLDDSFIDDLLIFPNLVSINFKNVKAGTIDLSGLSACADVRIFNSTIGTLKLSGLTTLGYFTAKWSFIENFEMDGLTNLKTIEMQGTRIKENDVIFGVDFPSLTYIDMTKTYLKDTIDGSKMPNLQTLIVSLNDELTGIDMGTFTKLKRLDAKDSGLTEITFPRTTLLAYIRLSGTQITVLDLTKIRTICQVECYVESLTEVHRTKYIDNLFTDATIITEEVEDPTEEPTSEPTDEPSEGPTDEPTGEETAKPTGEATETPTSEPTSVPTSVPTSAPTSEATSEPTSAPTSEPTSAPTSAPTSEPTNAPTEGGDPS